MCRGHINMTIIQKHIDFSSGREVLRRVFFKCYLFFCKDICNLLLDRNACPRIINLLYYVKWNNECSNVFSVSNGVKQGGVISPLLFSIYIDNLFNELKE